MGYIFMAINKIKCTKNLNDAWRHNLRLDYCENADKEHSEDNVQYVDRGMTYAQFFRKRVKEAKCCSCGKKIRSDAVMALDIILSVSKDEAKSNSLFDIDSFGRLAKEWLEEQYGEKNIAGISLHLDESAPHIHGMIIPITEDGRLSASEIMGYRTKMVALQDSLAEKMADIGLQRGLSHSVASRTTMKEFYHAVNQARADSLPIPKQGELAETYVIRANKVFNDYKSQMLAEMKTIIRERDEALTKASEIEREIDIYHKNAEVAKKNKDIIEDWRKIMYAMQSEEMTAEEKNTFKRLMAKALQKGAKLRAAELAEAKEKEDRR